MMKAWGWFLVVVASALFTAGITIEVRQWRSNAEAAKSYVARQAAPTAPKVSLPEAPTVLPLMKVERAAPAAIVVIKAPQPAPVAAAPAPVVEQPRIAVAAAVQGSVQAFAGGRGEGRALASGAALHRGDKIVTDAKGQLQVMLLDETVFALGPNAALSLEEFAFDPATDDGKVAVRIMRGAFRFSTGRIAHKNPANMTVQFPDSVLDVRGTIVTGNVSPQGTFAVLLGPGPNKDGERVGAFTLRTAAGRVDVDRPGFGSHVDAQTDRPSPPVHLSQSQLNSILSNFEPKAQKDSSDDRSDSRATAQNDDRKLRGTAQRADAISQTASSEHGKEEILKNSFDPGAAERAEAAARKAAKDVADKEALADAKAAKADADGRLADALDKAQAAAGAAKDADKAKADADKDAKAAAAAARAAQAADNAAANAKARADNRLQQAADTLANAKDSATQAQQDAADALKAAKDAADHAAQVKADAEKAAAAAKDAADAADKTAKPLDDAAAAAQAAADAASKAAAAADAKSSQAQDALTQANNANDQAQNDLQSAQDNSEFDDPSTDPAVIDAQATADAAQANADQAQKNADAAQETASEADGAAQSAQSDLDAANANRADADAAAKKADGDYQKARADADQKEAKAAKLADDAKKLADDKSDAKKKAEALAAQADADAKAAEKNAADKAKAKDLADKKKQQTDDDFKAAKAKAKAAREAADIADARARKADAAAKDAQRALDGAVEAVADAELGNPIDLKDLAHLLKDISYWNEVRAIEEGAGQYAGGGDFNLEKCDGQACRNPQGSFKFVLNVDFGKRTYGGDCKGDCAASGASFTASADNLRKGSVSDSLKIPLSSFAELNGPALIKARSESRNFSADIALKNGDETPAAAAEAAVKYFDGATKGSGRATAPLVDCANGACKK